MRYRIKEHKKTLKRSNESNSEYIIHNSFTRGLATFTYILCFFAATSPAILLLFNSLYTAMYMKHKSNKQGIILIPHSHICLRRSNSSEEWKDTYIHPSFHHQPNSPKKTCERNQPKHPTKNITVLSLIKHFHPVLSFQRDRESFSGC